MAVNPFAAVASMQDPYSMLQRSAGLTSSGVPLSIARQMAMFGGQQADVPYMSPQDEQSALALVGQMGAHAMGTVGALLDVPGGIVRNYLGGKDPLEPLQNPLTVTGRVTGRDLLKQWGIMGDTPAGLPWQPWKNPERMLRAAAGIGTEVLLDPTLFTSFLGGATTKAGKAMQSLGKPAMMELTDILKVGKRQAALRFGAIDELLKFSPNAAKYTDMLEAFAAKNATTLDALKSDRLGTAFGLHVPFTNIDVPLSTPLDLLAPTMDDTFGWLGRTTAGRMGKAAMNPEYLSTRSEYVQAQAPRIFNSILDMTADVRSKVEPIVTEVAQKHWFDPHHVARTLNMDELTSARHLVDDFGNDAINYVEFGKQIDFAKNGRHIPQAEQADVYRLLDEYKRITAEDLPKDLSLGIDIDALDQNVIGYYSRQINKLPESSFTAAGRRVMKVQRGYQEARPEMTAYLPTKMINELSIDSRFSGQAHGLAATGKGFYSQLGSEMQKEYGHRFASEIAAAEAKMGKPISWTGLARWVADMEPERAANRIPLYSTDVFTTMTRRVEAAAQSRSAAEGVHDILSANAKYYGDAITKGPKSESLMSVFSRTPGMKREEAMSAWISRHFSPEAMANDPARRKMFDKLEAAYGSISNMDINTLNKWGHAIKVPKEVGDDVNRIMAVFSAPEALGPMLDAWSAATNVWKKWVTIPWLQFHARNLISGLMRNWVGGHFNPIDYHHATAMIHSGSLGRGAARRYFTNTAGMTDEAATATLRNELFSQGVVSHHSGPQNLLEPIGGQTLDIPGVTRIMQPTRNISTPTGLARHVPSPVLTGLDTWSRSGAAAAYWVEAENRIAAYLNMRAKGMAPSAAAAKVRALQVGYDPIFATQTDKVIRQFIPFWCVPADHEILTEDGWKTYDCVQAGDMVLTMNVELGTLEWQPVAAIASFDYDGELMRLQKRSPRKKVDDGVVIEFLCTDNHRWPVETRTNRDSQDEAWSRKVMLAYQFFGKDDYRLMTTGDFHQEESILSPRLARILGWVITDGYFRYRGEHCEMMVYQSPKKFLDEVIELLGTKPRKPHPTTGVVCVPVALEDVKAIRKVFTSKSDMPSIVGRLSREAADAMWDAMFKAEGNCDQDGRPVQFTQKHEKNKPVLEAFQILCVLTGRAANLSPSHDPKGCYVRRRTHYRVQYGVDRVKYTGKIWCPVTPNGTWVMRNNGAVVVTGNTFNKGITPWTLKSLIENPGGPLAQVAKRTATMRSKDPVLPEAVENTAAIQLPTDEPGGMKFLSTLGMMEEGLYGFAAPLLQIPFGIAESLGVPVKAGSMPHVAGGEAMREILSQSNPFVKGLIEMATQRSLYHGAGEPGGRPLQSLNPPFGSLVARGAEALTGQPHTPKPIGGFVPVGLGHPLEQALPMVPGFARLLSTINTLTNPRTTWGERAMNVGTGLRIMDISPAQIAARRNEMLRNAMTTYGARTFTKPYFRPEDLASMLPHERRQADLLNQLSRWMSYKYRQEQKENNRN